MNNSYIYPYSFFCSGVDTKSLPGFNKVVSYSYIVITDNVFLPTVAVIEVAINKLV